MQSKIANCQILECKEKCEFKLNTIAGRQWELCIWGRHHRPSDLRPFRRHVYLGMA